MKRTTVAAPAAAEHVWSKRNVVALSDDRGPYDAVRCDGCGATGKRRLPRGNVERDREYSSPIFDSCAEAKPPFPQEGKK